MKDGLQEFGCWIAGVERELASHVDPEAFRCYHERGLTPAEAVRQDRLDAGVLEDESPAPAPGM